MNPPSLQSSEPTVAEAGAWADVLVRRRLQHVAVQILTGPAGFLALTASIQHRIRSTRPESR
ncbi:hypothetical protein NJO91_13170 [Streptomyces microflavus]|uniref:hypothetical protein n=1 Tax=Streptomyces microflavus TaxID=1919 RepID=UPI0029A74CEE|nr:hypothetical protein [Streptomyces microflavus]MDX2404071.1 hypothetical protein [Streptomyces microflavus]